tara:strand:- start:40 stop:366 length:327 start_codon:yes stop_codon:yes gene_type:complete
MSFIDIINNKFENIINDNFNDNQDEIKNLTYIESDVISLIKEKKYNTIFNDSIDGIFSNYNNSICIDYKCIIDKLISEIKNEYIVYLNNLEKQHVELIKTQTYIIEAQ